MKIPEQGCANIHLDNSTELPNSHCLDLIFVACVGQRPDRPAALTARAVASEVEMSDRGRPVHGTGGNAYWRKTS
jgi:hypothetical protein